MLVLILPMRNGNYYCKKTVKMLLFVLILPMRNGNQVLLYMHLVQFFCSYPTYEEWKPCKISSNSLFSLLVLILPMRNGNPNSIACGMGG